jgi:hypothetical protein
LPGFQPSRFSGLTEDRFSLVMPQLLFDGRFLFARRAKISNLVSLYGSSPFSPRSQGRGFFFTRHRTPFGCRIERKVSTRIPAAEAEPNDRGFAMLASTLNRNSTRIPNVVCAMCGSRMRLATMEPEDSPGSKVTFDCSCGHVYEVSRQALNDLAQDSSDRW